MRRSSCSRGFPDAPGWRIRDVVAHVVHDYVRKLSGMLTLVATIG
jgi:hypothetical protein